MEPIPQEHPAGCAVACVASLCGITYSEALCLFNTEYAAYRGYYCREIIAALKGFGRNYSYKKVTDKTRSLLGNSGVIVFVARSESYPIGHFLINTERGWLDPWINYPLMMPVKAGFREKLPDNARWVIFENKK